MRSIILFVLFFGVIPCAAQSKKVLSLMLKDDSIFETFKRNFSDFPKNYLVNGKFRKWDSRRFWLEDIQQLSADSIMRIETDEHNPYNFIYLFSDTSLNQLFSNDEKRHLSEKASALKEKKVFIKNEKFKIAKDISTIKGYFFEITEPIFDSKSLFAFIDIYIYHNDLQYTNGIDGTQLLGTICIVYQKQSGGVWKQLKVQSLLTL